MGGDTLTKTLWLPVAVRTGMCRGHGEEGDMERQGFSSREILLPLLLPASGRTHLKKPLQPSQVIALK